MEHKTRPLSELREWDRNPRNIKKDDYLKLKDQITLLGQYKPILAMTDGTVLGGNMRLKALRELGVDPVWVSEIDFVEKNGLWYAVVNQQEQAKPFSSRLQGMTEYALSDNDRAGYYDQDMLTTLMSEVEIDLNEYHVDFGEPVTIGELLGLNEEITEDEPPAVDTENEPVSKLGEVYQLGRHRLMCGDATKIEDVERLMSGQKANMVFTDPPYGISIVSKDGSVGGSTEGKYRPVLNDGNTQVAIDAYNLFAGMNVPKMIFWGGNYYANSLPNSPCWIVWDKQDGKHVTFADCELAWTNFESPTRMYTHVWDGFRRDSEQGENRVHPTQKPVKLLAEILKDYGNEDDTVIDVFGGSGATLIACEQTNRICYMMELDPKYCDVIRKRYQKLKTGAEDDWQKDAPQIST